LKLSLKSMDGDLMECFDAAAERVEVLPSSVQQVPRSSKRVMSRSHSDAVASPARKQFRAAASQPPLGEDTTAERDAQWADEVAKAVASISQVPSSCIAWSFLVCYPEVKDVPNFMDLALSPGPHTYEKFAEVVQEAFLMDAIEDLGLLSDADVCFLHVPSATGAGAGHCCPLRLASAGGHKASTCEPADDGHLINGQTSLHDMQDKFVVRVRRVGDSMPAERSPLLACYAGARHQVPEDGSEVIPKFQRGPWSPGSSRILGGALPPMTHEIIGPWGT
jgi:hypothetical protein